MGVSALGGAEEVWGPIVIDADAFTLVVHEFGLGGGASSWFH